MHDSSRQHTRPSTLEGHISHTKADKMQVQTILETFMVDEVTFSVDKYRGKYYLWHGVRFIGMYDTVKQAKTEAQKQVEAQTHA